VIKKVMITRSVTMLGLVLLVISALNVNAASLVAFNGTNYSHQENSDILSFRKRNNQRGRKAFSVSELDGTFEVLDDRMNIKKKPLFG